MSLQSLAQDLRTLGIRYHIVTATSVAAAITVASKKKPIATLKVKQRCDTKSAIKWFSAAGKKPFELSGVTAVPKRGGVDFNVKNATLTISTNDNRMSIKVAGKKMPITAAVFMDLTDRLANSNEAVLKYIMRRFKYWAGVMAKPAYLEKINTSKKAKAASIYLPSKLVYAAANSSDADTGNDVEYGLWTGWNVITPSGLCLKTTSGIKGTVPAKVILKNGKYTAFTSEQEVSDWRGDNYKGRRYGPNKYVKTAADCREIELLDSEDESQGLEDVMTPGPDQVACPMASVVPVPKFTGKVDFTSFDGFKEKGRGSYDDRLHYVGLIENQKVELRQDAHGNVEVVFPFKLQSGKKSLQSVPVHNKKDWEALLAHIHRCFDLGY